MSDPKWVPPADKLSAAAADMYRALDEIGMMISYLIVHGVGEQPPPREDGLPQIMRATPQELGLVVRRIGDLSRVAREKAEGQ